MDKKFTSSTINLYFNHEDFLTYALNLKAYSENATPIEATDEEEKFPVGILKKEGLPDVKIFFMHYPNFAMAKGKWTERTKRIDFDNVLIVFDSLNFDLSKSQINGFNEISWKKIALIKNNNLNIRDSFVFDKFIPDYESQETLLNCLKTNRFYQWRYLDYLITLNFLIRVRLQVETLSKRCFNINNS